jgi:Zn-dependent metalloprotease
MFRRFLFVAVVSMLILVIIINAANPAGAQGQKQSRDLKALKAAQREALSSLGNDITIELSSESVPSYLMGPLSLRLDADPIAAAQSSLEKHGAAFRRGPGDGFIAGKVMTDELGMTHVRMKQTYKGIEVISGELTVHLTEQRVVGINGHFVPDLELKTAPVITPDQAVSQAVEFVKAAAGLNPTLDSIGRRVVFVDEGGAGHLAIPVRVRYSSQNGLEIDDIFVDATEGAVLGLHPLVWRSLLRSIYNGNQSCDQNTLPGSLIFQEGGSSSDGVAMAAYDGTGKTYQFYLFTFQRDSYNGLGSPLVSTVHFQFAANSGCTRNNAAWLGTRNQMAYGDGDGVNFASLASGLDVTAHEVTHGVTQYTANLTYASESGALNEATSDILGESAASYWGQGDWKIGAEVYTPGIAGDALRYMYAPSLDGASPDYYPERLYASGCTPSPANDSCGVHNNSGIANLFFYLLSQGGSHPRGKTSVVVPGIGIDKAQKIWYRALVAYMTPSTNFQGARSATKQAAYDLFGGACTPEYKSVEKAWSAVGVTGTSTCCETECCYTVSPTLVGIGAGVGEEGIVMVTTGAGCSWTSRSNSSWIIIDSGSSGVGNGGVGFHVLGNNTGQARSGTMTVAGKIVTVRQSNMF